MKLSIRTQLDYDFPTQTDVLLQLEAAAIPEQTIEAAHIDISPTLHFARVAGHNTIGDRIWLSVQGKLTVDYSSRIVIRRMTADCSALNAVPVHQLPGETVEYLLPSRYCPSDQFHNLVEAEFGGLLGGARIMAIRDWINSSVAYVAGSSDTSTGALETFVARQGVCRDFAHLLICLARASSIPARFAWSCWA